MKEIDWGLVVLADRKNNKNDMDDYERLDVWLARKHEVIVAAVSAGKSYEEAEEICDKLEYNARIELIKDSIDRKFNSRMEFYRSIVEQDRERQEEEAKDNWNRRGEPPAL